MAASEDDLLAFLADLAIAVTTHRHPPLHTVEEAKQLRGDLPGGHAKTLLVRDKKKAAALVVVQEDRRLDLKWLAEALAMKRLSFASAERLEATLGVAPGAVTPFALINRQCPPADPGGLKVVLDSGLLDQDPLNFHPLHNAATTTISSSDLLRFIGACGYAPQTLDFGGAETAPASHATAR